MSGVMLNIKNALAQHNDFFAAGVLFCALIFLLALRLGLKKYFWIHNASDLGAEYKTGHHLNLLPDFEKKYKTLMTPVLWFRERLKESKIVRINSEIVGSYNGYLFDFFQIERVISVSDATGSTHLKNARDTFLLIDVSAQNKKNVNFEIRRKVAAPVGWRSSLVKFINNEFPAESYKEIQFTKDEFIYHFITPPDEKVLEVVSKKKIQNFIFDLLEIPIKSKNKKKKIVYQFSITEKYIAVQLDVDMMQRYSGNYPLSYYLEYLTSVAGEL